MLYKSCAGKNFLAKINCGLIRIFYSVLLLSPFVREDLLGAQTVTLAWDGNTDLQTRGYFLYSADAGGTPLGRSDVGNNTSAVVSSLADGAAYVFYVTAYNGTGQESDPSNKITYQAVASNVAPTADNKSLQMLQDQALPVVLSGVDQNGDALTFNVVTGPAHGALSGATPNLTYTPARGFYGQDSFIYVANDGKASSAPATVSITVQRVNHAPIADAKSIQVLENQSGAVTLSGSDWDGDPLSFKIVSAPTHGILSGTAPSLTYKPVANFYGTDVFMYRVNDGSLDSLAATVNISVLAVNQAPQAASKSLQTLEDVSINISLAGTDPDGDALSYTIVSAPTHGTLSGTAPNLIYTPASNFAGTDSFTYQASDGILTSGVATVTITITPVNDPPIAHNQAIQTSINQSISIQLVGDDPDGDALSFTVVNTPAHGTLTGTVPNITYVPAIDYTGADSFTFTVNDGSLVSALGTVGISVVSNTGKLGSGKLFRRRK